MRDPKRIHRILSQLGVLWYQYPDMRLGQLLDFIAFRKDTSDKPEDPFYIEDDEWEARFDRLIEEAQERAFLRAIR